MKRLLIFLLITTRLNAMGEEAQQHLERLTAKLELCRSLMKSEHTTDLQKIAVNNELNLIKRDPFYIQAKKALSTRPAPVEFFKEESE